VRELVFDNSWFHFRTNPYFETITGFQLIRVFGTYSSFETITGILINVNFLAFTLLRTKTRYIQNKNKIENKNKLFFYNLKYITSLKNQNINIICSYNVDLTRNAENGLLKRLENKLSIFSNLTDKMWKLRF